MNTIKYFNESWKWFEKYSDSELKHGIEIKNWGFEQTAFESYLKTDWKSWKVSFSCQVKTELFVVLETQI